MEIPANQERIYSNEYADLIIPIPFQTEDFLSQYETLTPQVFGGRLGMVHILRTGRVNWETLSYALYPHLFTLLDTTSLEVSGILRFQTQPNLAYKGDHILLGFIDTGIDYTLDAFRHSDGSTRILGIWDQNLPSDTPPFDMGYGTAFTSDDINRALASDDPLSFVPTMDTNGHGTALAGIASGSSDPVGQFTGAAPQSSIAMVKLKPAKQYLRDYYLIPDDAAAFQETDLMMGLRYLLSLSVIHRLPLVICIGLGSNQGDHNGTTPLERLLDYFVDYQQCYCTVAGGNEAGRAHHYFHQSASDGMEDVAEILVDPQNAGFSLEIWADSLNLYRLSITSPLGEEIPINTLRQGQSLTFPLIAERTILEIRYEIAEYSSGGQLIFIRFLLPTPGIWRMRLVNTGQTAGSFHIWLPITGLISPGTYFLNPNVYTTLTTPSNARSVITVSTYNAYTGSLYIHSSRGFRRDHSINPDLAAPGVEVYAPASSMGRTQPLLSRYIRYTGSSAAAAITAGAIALLINWGMDRAPFSLSILSNRSVKNYLTRGAIRQDDLVYPNQEWGYGILNLYGIFEALM